MFAIGKLDELEIKLPQVAPRTAALITGVICGLVAVLLGWLSASGCQAVRGVGTCGGFGLIALIAILAIEVILGGTLLRSWGISEPTSTAFLGVGLVAVAAMLFFLGSIGSVWMLLVIPVLTAATFLLSWWITAAVIDD